MNDKCIVFDFDCTLTYRHYHYFMINQSAFLKKWSLGNEYIDYYKKINNIQYDEDIVNKFLIYLKELPNKIIQNNLTENDKQILITIIFGSHKRLHVIKSMLRVLKKNNYDIYLSSRGYCDNLIKMLMLCNLYKYFKRISCVGCNDSTYNNIDIMGKVPFFEKYIIGKYNKIIYIDDNSDEHNEMINHKKLNDFSYEYYGPEFGLQSDGNGLSYKMISVIFDMNHIHI